MKKLEKPWSDVLLWEGGITLSPIKIFLDFVVVAEGEEASPWKGGKTGSDYKIGALNVQHKVAMLSQSSPGLPSALGLTTTSVLIWKAMIEMNPLFFAGNRNLNW